MPDRKEGAQEHKRMKKAATVKQSEEPLLGEAVMPAQSRIGDRARTSC